ncbi:hypothetical protein ES705_18158 [subsurface metagenome]|jgi:excisionase family DNA binding protein|nr:MAG: helix-turn-helix domain-containing protein [Candidatus Atribacteria bacterium 1244-E10-H5-B2]
MTIKIDNEIYYTVRDLTSLLSLTELTVRAYLREGKLLGHKPGQFWYVSEEALKTFMKGTKRRKRFLGVF